MVLYLKFLPGEGASWQPQQKTVYPLSCPLRAPEDTFMFMFIWLYITRNVNFSICLMSISILQS